MALKAIRLEVRQTMVNYRKPASFAIKETYPLPPYSSVIGMVHNACGFTKYHPMQVSVQGECRGSTFDFYKRYSFGNAKFEAGRHTFGVPDGENGLLGVFQGIAHTELLCDVRLVLHIVPEENDFETVLQGLRCPEHYLSLGRHEDLLDIDEIAVVEVDEAAEVETPLDVYVPTTILEDANEKEGTLYLMGIRYVIDPKTQLRRWMGGRISVKHLPRGSILDNFPTDGEYPVALCPRME